MQTWVFGLPCFIVSLADDVGHAPPPFGDADRDCARVADGHGRDDGGDGGFTIGA